MTKPKETPTRVLQAPRTEIGDNKHVEHISHRAGYRVRINELLSPPLTTIDKHNEPHLRNYHTAESINEIQDRVSKLRLILNEK